MPNRIESQENSQPRKPDETTVYNDAVTSAVSSIAAYFLRENKEKGRSIRDLKRGVEIRPDGTEKKLEPSSSR